MNTNDLIQWICVAIIFVVVMVWIVRYIRGLVEWSRSIRKKGGAAGHPPCCGGRHTNGGKCGLGKGRHKPDAPCAGCGQDCPLAGSRSPEKLGGVEEKSER